jgi:hypothetical protein
MLHGDEVRDDVGERAPADLKWILSVISPKSKIELALCGIRTHRSDGFHTQDEWI